MSSGFSGNPFGAYLLTIMEWHGKSAEMARYVTTRPTSGRGSNASASSEGQKSDNSISTAETSASEQSTSILHYTSPQGHDGGGARHTKLPVALVSNGYSLTTLRPVRPRPYRSLTHTLPSIIGSG